MNKSELRKIYIEDRRSLSADEVAEASRRIAERFFAAFDLTSVRVLHCFIPISKFNEVDTSHIFNRIWRDFPHIRTVAPRVNSRTGELEHLVYAADSDLIENPWGIREPAGKEQADPIEIDLVVVPLLCFDKGGHRVGYGRGYYDRFLARCRADCRKVAVSFFPPVDSIDDLHEGDIALGAVVGPARVYLFPHTR